MDSFLRFQLSPCGSHRPCSPFGACRQNRSRSRLAIFVIGAVWSVLLALAPPLAAGGPVDGVPDLSFSGDGQVVLNNGFAGDYSNPRPLEGPDGALVVLARRSTGAGKAWIWFRVAADGAVFGCPFVPPGATDLLERPAAAFDGAGRLVVVGSAIHPGGIAGSVARFLYPACSPDPSFGTAGFAVLDPTAASEGATAVAIDRHDPLHRIFVAGFYITPNIVDTLFYSLHENGTLRAGEFGALGWVRVDAALLQRAEIPSAILLQPDGKIVAAGILGAEAGFSIEVYLQRLLPNGTRDFDFGAPIDEGAVIVSIAPDNLTAIDAVLDPRSGDFVLAGQANAAGQTGEAAIVRLLPTGDLDSGFGSGGVRRFDFAGHNDSSLTGIVVDGLGRLVVGGTTRTGPSGSNYELVAARLVGSEFDGTFGDAGVAIVPFDLGNPLSDRGTGLALQAGRPVVTGEIFDADDTYKVGIARLTTALLFADGFEQSGVGGTGAWSRQSP